MGIFSVRLLQQRDGPWIRPQACFPRKPPTPLPNSELIQSIEVTLVRTEETERAAMVSTAGCVRDAFTPGLIRSLDGREVVEQGGVTTRAPPA